MTLQRKFAVLIGLMSLTAAVSLGGAIWSVGLLDSEVARPFTATAMLSRDLRDAGHAAERIVSAVTNGVDVEEARDALGAFSVASDTLGDLDYGAVRLGARTSQLLRQSAEGVLESGGAWVETRGDGVRAELESSARSHLSLLRRLEAQAASSAELAVEHVSDIRRGLLLAQVFAVVTALLAALLALSFHRRWIVEPVARLRVGAERLASGDLDYRIEERGRDELAMLGREVNHMAATIKRMQSQAVERERFAAVGQVVRRLAHNIRNPLAGIRGLAETTLDDLPDDAEQRDAQRRIITTVDRFDGWLTDFLRATSPNEVVLAPSDPGVWLDAALAALRPMAESRGVALSLNAEGAPVSAIFDRVQLEQALVAVVTNAVEVTPRGGEVEIRVGSSRGEGGEGWTISVLDDGPGIDEGASERIFEADYTTKPGGHGIGLTAARWIVRRHGGMMCAQNAEEASGRRGARFDISLPLGGRPGHDDGEVDRAEHPDR